MTVSRDGGGGRQSAVGREYGALFSGMRVPEDHRRILANGRKQRRVAGERDGVDLPAVTRKRVFGLWVRCVPNASGTVRETGCHERAIERGSDAEHALRKPAKHLRGASRDAPANDLVVLATAD